MQTANISVLMATFNRECFVAESLNSLINQTLPPKQIIVVNDGSTDNTKQVLEPFLNEIIYLEKTNGGKSSALNLALQYVTGDYILVFDDDDVAFPDALERHIQTLETNPTIDFTYSSYCQATSKSDSSINPGPDVKTLDVDPNQALVKMLENCFMIQPSMLVRSSAFFKTAPYDLRLIRSQDYDFLLRLNKKYRGTMIKGPTFYRRYHSGIRGSNTDLIDDTNINRKWYEYEKISIKKQYISLELKDYLFKNTTYNQENKQLALIQRTCILAIKGLWDEFCIELKEIHKNHSENQLPALTKDENSVCQKALTNPYSIMDLLNNQYHFNKVLTHIKSIKISGFRLELAKGLFHNLYLNNNQFSVQEKYKIVILIINIVGWKNFISALLTNFKKVFN